jgi:hypothetical protein
VRFEGDLTRFVEIKKGVRQGCVFSPDLLNLYRESVLKEIEDLHGIAIGGVYMNNVRYADDTALITDSNKKLQVIVDKLVTESEKKGLYMNIKKTECMVISKKKTYPQCTIFINGEQVKKVYRFNYLVRLRTSDSKCYQDIKRRIVLAKEAFSKMKSILTNSKITMETKVRLLECYVFPVLTYGCECWTISQEMERRLNATEMWFLRRMMKIRWTSHISNEEVLTRSGYTKKLMQTIRKRQLKFFGHITRKEGMEHLITTGKMEGKRDRERQ